MKCEHCGRTQPEGVLIDRAVEAAIAFAKQSTYLHHPSVRPWGGTANGDSQEKWERDYFIELCRTILAAAAPSSMNNGSSNG
jgi:hypothetical protein